MTPELIVYGHSIKAFYMQILDLKFDALSLTARESFA
jgi:hypothetical protein